MGKMSSRVFVCSIAALSLGLVGCEQGSAPTSETTATETPVEAEVPALTASQSLFAMADRHAAEVLREAPSWATPWALAKILPAKDIIAAWGNYGFEGTNAPAK